MVRATIARKLPKQPSLVPSECRPRSEKTILVVKATPMKNAPMPNINMEYMLVIAHLKLEWD